MRAWHERYADAGLRVIGVHSPGFAPSLDPAAVRAAVARLDVPYPVVVDSDLEVWDLYGNQGWPARYLFDRALTLVDYHYGEGAYDESERAIAELLDVEPPPFAPLRPEDAPGAAARAPDRRPGGRLLRPLRGRRRVGGGRRAGARCRPTAGGSPSTGRAAWRCSSTSAAPPACSSSRSPARRTCHATCFTPGLAP